MIIHRNLGYMLKLAELGNFRRAAEALHITHSALVRSIKAAEDELGARIFDRGAGIKVTPTEIGAVYLEQARRIFLLNSDLRQDIQEILGLSKGELNIALGPYPNKISGHVAAGRLLSRYPNLKVRISVVPYAHVVEAILERRADLGIAEYSEASSIKDLAIEPLEPHPAFFVCRAGHPLLGQGRLSAAHLVAYPWGMTRAPSRVCKFLPTDLGKAGSRDLQTGEFVPTIQLDSINEMAEIVARSDVLGLGTLHMFRSELGSGALKVVPFRKPWLVSGYGFMTLKHRNLSPAVVAYMHEVRAVEQEYLREEQELIATLPREGFVD